LGLISLIALSICGKRCLSSFFPSLSPADEYGWQGHYGNPPQTIVSAEGFHLDFLRIS